MRADENEAKRKTNVEKKKISKLAIAAIVVVWTAIVVSVDTLFLQHRFWERLAVNVGICVVFFAIYMIFNKKR